MTGLTIRRAGAAALSSYGQVPIAFTVRSRLRIAALPAIVEEPVNPPWLKDYDAIPGEGPTRWAKRWDFSNWVVLSAADGDHPVGGAVVARNTAGVDMLEGRTDLACLWDLRVHPDRRGEGIGTALVREAVHWAEERGCRVLKVETQDINVPACRFYQARGFVLKCAQPDAYADFPDEAMLLWYRDIP